MTHFVVANIDDIILLPVVACGVGVTVRKRLHGPLQDPPRLSLQVKDATQDRCFCDLSTITRGSEFDCVSKVSGHFHSIRLPMQGGHTQNDLGNSLRAVTDALKISRDGGGRSQVAQVATSKRLLEG